MMRWGPNVQMERVIEPDDFDVAWLKLLIVLDCFGAGFIAGMFLYSFIG